MLFNVLPYFRECMCSLKYEEWKVEIDSEEPPSTIVEKSFRLEVGDITANPVRHTTFNFIVPVQLVIYQKTYRDACKGMDEAILKTDEILCCLLEVRRRYGTQLKSVSPTNINYQALSDSNDNTIKVVMDFEVQLEIEYRDVSPV